MIKSFALFLVLALTSAAFAQTDGTKKLPGPTLVTVSSKGHDVRAVLHDMFKQAEKSFVLEPNIRFGLFLSLEKIEFEEALRLVCRMASLQIDVQNGIYFINKVKPPVSAAPTTAVKGSFEAKPKGKLPETVLNKRLTTRLDKVDFRALMAEIGKQTGVDIEIADGVPVLKLDSYLINTSLKFALDSICGATKLQYRFTENLTLEIYKPAPVNRVAVVGGS